MKSNSPFLKTLSEIREEPGMSNAGKYPNVAKSDFCGPKGTYPVNTLKSGSLGTINSLGLAKVKKAKYVLASTSEVYGDPQISPQKEN